MHTLDVWLYVLILTTIMCLKKTPRKYCVVSPKLENYFERMKGTLPNITVASQEVYTQFVQVISTGNPAICVNKLDYESGGLLV